MSNGFYMLDIGGPACAAGAVLAAVHGAGGRDLLSDGKFCGSEVRRLTGEAALALQDQIASLMAMTGLVGSVGIYEDWDGIQTRQKKDIGAVSIDIDAHGRQRRTEEGFVPGITGARS